jgi:seryl-tRNA synthetase
MALTKSQRGRKTQPPEPAPGATLNLQDPQSFINWLASNAEGFQENAKQNRENARAIWAAAAKHDRNEKAVVARMGEKQAELDALAKELDELRAERESERQQKEMRAAEAKQVEERAQNSENAAADIHASIPVIQQAVANGSSQSPTTTAIDLDPKETARIEGALSRIDAAHAELPADQRDEDDL